MNSNPETLFTGQTIVSKDEVDSTNNLAAAMLSEFRLAEGTVIMAKGQHAGRGQQGTTWESEHGKNLLVSFVFYPSFLLPKNIFLLNIAFSLALYDLANKLLKKDVSIKWPNDLYYKNKKLAGMLIENSIRNSEFNYCILGIGLNVNQTQFSANAANPTSLKSELNAEQDIQQVFNMLCENIEARYLQLKSNANSLKEEYLQVLYQFNIAAKYRSNSKTLTGKIINVTDDGKLVLEIAEGKKESFGFKEISFVLPSPSERSLG